MRVAVVGNMSSTLVRLRGDLLREMVRHGHEVFVLAPDYSASDEASLTSWGVNVRYCFMNRTSVNPLSDARSVLSLTRVLSRIQPDVILTAAIKPLICGTLAASWAGVPRRYAMLTGLGYSFLETKGLKGRFSGVAVRVLCRLATTLNATVFFHNDDDVELLRAMGSISATQRTLTTGGSGVDLNRYQVAPFPQSPPTFLFAGRLLVHKGVVEFVEAARFVKRLYPTARFILVGTLDSNPACVGAAAVAQWASDGVVEYWGWQADIRAAITAAHVCVLPSHREGVSRFLLEGMAMGRPIITTLAPGCRQLVPKNENGFLVPVSDTAALSAAVLSILEQPELIPRMGQAARTLVERSYSAEHVNREVLREMGLLSIPLGTN